MRYDWERQPTFLERHSAAISLMLAGTIAVLMLAFGLLAP